MSKLCRKCLMVKPVTMFTVNRINLDGRHSYCRECRSIERKTHYQNNRERMLRQCKAYRDSRQEYQKEKSRRYYERMKESVLKRTRKYQLENIDRVRQWAVIQMSKRRARIAAGGTFTLLEWTNLCARYNHRCLCCGRQTKLTPDHVVPISRGGSNTISNIQPLCGPCNSRKFTKTIDFRKG